MGQFDITIINNSTAADGTRSIAVETCASVCSKQIDITVNGGIIKQVLFTGGCNGNTQGIASLVAGMKVKDAIARLEGIDCSGRGTSCPDQLAKALALFL